MNDGWASFNPVVSSVIETLLTKPIREAEEGLMLVVLGKRLNVSKSMCWRVVKERKMIPRSGRMDYGKK
jgi:hypothetical protein